MLLKITNTSKIAGLAIFLGWQDVRQSYRRSSIGPYWLTIGMAVQIGALAVVFGFVLRNNLAEYLPFVATGIIFWTFISTFLIESCQAFIAAEAIMRQIPLSPWVFVGRVIWRNLSTLAHNAIILPFVMLLNLGALNANLVLELPAIFLVSFSLLPLGISFAISTARFRDLSPIVISGVGIMFYALPILWQPSLLPEKIAFYLLGLNPVYHCLQVLRLPVLGKIPTAENWIGVIVFALLNWLIALALLKMSKRKLTLWL